MVRKFKRRMRRRFKSFKRRPFRRYGRKKKAYGNARFKGGAHALRPAYRYGGLFPKKKLVTLRWNNAFGVAGPELVSGQILRAFSANAAWDPDVTGAGYPAKGYHFYANYYNHAVVLASKVNIRYVQQSTAQGDVARPTVLLGKLDDDGHYFETEDYRTWTTDPYCKYKFYNTTSPATTAKMSSLTLYFNAKKFFGVKNPADSDRLSSLSRSTPAERAYFLFAHQSMDLVTPPPDVVIFVTIDYKILFTERKDEIAWNGIPETPTAPEVPPEDDPVNFPYAAPPDAAGPVAAAPADPPLTPPP